MLIVLALLQLTSAQGRILQLDRIQGCELLCRVLACLSSLQGPELSA